MNELDKAAEEMDVKDDKEVCPDCGSPIIYESGCERCSNPNCLWSKCG